MLVVTKAAAIAPGEACKLYASLTPRELEVAELIAQMSKNRSIAEKLGMSIKTLDIHRANILRKLQTKSIIKVAMIALQVTLHPDLFEQAIAARMED